MLKMLMDPMGGIVITNDGNAILREIDVSHPAAKSMLELSRAQDEEVGDGTTSVIVLAGELMQAAKPFFEMEIHPSVVTGAYYKALNDGLEIINQLAQPIDVSKDAEIRKALTTCIGTKFAARWGSLVTDLAFKAVRCVAANTQGATAARLGIDIKRYAKVEKIPGGVLEDCEVLEGVMVNKDITHSNMRRTIKNPRIMLLDCPLEYKKGESQTNMEMTTETAMVDALQEEVNEIATLCNHILKLKPDVVVTEKGVSDIAQHFLLKGNVSVIRRVRKTDNNRIARVSGATIVNRPEELQESDIGTKCGLFDVRKIGDDYFTYFVESQDAKACTIMLRGASKDVLNEMERNLHDALAVARNLMINPKIVPGGGAIELELSKRLLEKSKAIEGLQQLPYKAVAYALEIIPKTLAKNCGADVVRVITALRAKHAENSSDGQFLGIDGNSGKVADMREANVWDPLAVKLQTFKTAIESSCMLLRIDDVVSGIKKKGEKKAAPQGGMGGMPGMPGMPGMGGMGGGDPEETFGDARDG